MLTLLAMIPLMVWLYLLCARGGFWRVPPAPAWQDREQHASVVVLIPARNEAACIATTVGALLAQRYAGAVHVVVIDDASEDDTGAAARRAAEEAGAAERVTVLRGADPPRGWTGKLWALEQGLALARARDAQFVWLTDADIRHGPDTLARLVSLALRGEFDLVSFMVRLSTNSRAERWLIPAFVFFFFKLYPPAWVASRSHRLAAAAGGCILIRAPALARIGGFTRIRAQVIDDCALAREVKNSGGRVWLGLAPHSESLRPYGSIAEIGAMIARTAFAQLRHSYTLVVLTVLGMGLIYLAPVALLLADNRVARLAALAALALMSLLYAPMVRFYRLNLLWTLTLPAAALFYVGAVVISARNFSHGRGGQWKGRAQDVAE